MTDDKKTGGGNRSTLSPNSALANTGAETRTTIILVAIALICVGITAVAEYMTKPAQIAEYGKVGQEFYPDFVDPTQATSLLVRTVDKDSARAVEFSVRRNEDGQWVIPSHHNYPADAEERLARTAASVIGIKRGALVTRWATDHPRYGVVDPARDTLDVEELDGVGTRLVLRGPDDSVLFDLIIGKKVEGEGDENQFYVRHPDEDEVYIATLDIDLSTRFSDWIDTDLLAIDSFDTRLLEIRDYQFDELQGTLTQAEISRLHRDSSSSDWKLDGLDETKYEVDQQKVRDTINTLANLEIVGVRPKQPGLTPELTLDRSVIKSQRDVDQLQSDLLARGFLLQPASGSDPNTLKLLAREGEMTVATEDAVAYDLYFGRAFTGTQEELELGFAKSDQAGDANRDNEEGSAADGEEADNAGDAEASNDERAGEDDAQAESQEKSNDEDAKKDESKKPGRYVFVRARVESSVLGQPPAPPVEPQKPAALVEAEQRAEPASEDSNSDDAEQDGASDQGEENASQPAGGDGADGADGDAGEAAADSQDGAADGAGPQADGSEKQDEGDDELAKLKAEYEQAVAQYEEAKRQYDEYQEKLKAAQEKVDELNRRFAKWYYVIPGEDYEKLSLHRSDLIKEKEPAGEEAAGGDASGATGLSLPQNPLSGSQTPAATGNEPSAEGDGQIEEPPAPNPPQADGQAREEPDGEKPAGASVTPADAPPAAASQETPAPPAAQPSDGPAAPEQPPAPEPVQTDGGN